MDEEQFKPIREEQYKLTHFTQISPPAELTELSVENLPPPSTKFGPSPDKG
jgi:hypothetical protein